MLLNPRKLKYIDLLLSSTAGKTTHLATASEVKRKINAEVIAMLTAVIVEISATANTAAVGGVDAGPVQGGGAASTGQRPKTPQAAAAASHNANRIKGAGVFDDSDDSGVDLESPGERAPKEEDKSLREAWLALKVRIQVCTRASTRHLGISQICLDTSYSCVELLSKSKELSFCCASKVISLRKLDVFRTRNTFGFIFLLLTFDSVFYWFGIHRGY